MISNANRAATNFLKQIGSMEPSDITMEEIAWSCGLMVRYKEIDGSQGRIVMTNEEGIITINSAVTYQPKINFIIAHEIGHAQLHRNLIFFTDNEKTLADWYKNGPHEKEANSFAAELLMPAELFISKVSNQKLSISLVESVAHYFGASIIATFLRYKVLGRFPLMVIFIEEGIIKWKSYSDDFPYKWLVLGTQLPAFTVAGDFYYHQAQEKKPEKVDAIEWFPEDFNCQREKHAKVWEQCFRISSTALVTCIWTA